MSDIDKVLGSYEHAIQSADWADTTAALAVVASARAEIAALRAARSDMLLLWKWGAGGQVGTGFAEKLGGDGDGETWAVRFDPMDPDGGAEFVVRIVMGDDGFPVLDDAARTALAAKEDRHGAR